MDVTKTQETDINTENSCYERSNCIYEGLDSLPIDPRKSSIVEVQREKGARCFFPVISLTMLMGVQLAIGSPYTIQQGSVFGSIPFISLMISGYIMAHHSNVGQTFVNQVGAAEELLKDIGARTQDLRLNIKVRHVMGSLSPLLAFDMCGWYTLGYSSFLGLINAILTYLVIIFQIGGNTFDELSPSSQKNVSASS